MDISIGGSGQHKPAKADDPIFNDPACKNVSREFVECFLAAWAVYPTRRGGNPRRMAFKAFIARAREGVNPEHLLTATRNYRQYCIDAGAEGTPYVLHGATFYGVNERWRDFLVPQAAKTDAESDDMAREIRETWMRGGKAS